MNIFDILNGGANRMGGAIGAALQPLGNAMGSGQAAMPAQQPASNQNKVMQNPAYASALTRLGLNLMATGGQGGDFLSNLGTAGAATVQQMDKLRMDNQSIAESQAKMQPSAPFSGDGFDNQAAATQYQFYVSQGVPDLEARQRAVNDVLASKPQMQMVTDQAGNVRMVPVPRPTLPMGQTAQQQAVPQVIPQSMQEESLPAQMPMLDAPQGGLLPPPDLSSQTQDMSMVQGLTAGNPKAAQLAVEQQVKGAIEQQQGNTQVLKGLQKSANIIQNLLNESDKAFTPTGLPVKAKQSIARFTGADGQVAEQLAATSKVQGLTVEALGPMLRELVGQGVVTNTDYNNAMRVFGDPNASPPERRAVLEGLQQRTNEQIQRLGGSQPATGGYKDMSDDELMKVIMGGQ